MQLSPNTTKNTSHAAPSAQVLPGQDGQHRSEAYANPDPLVVFPLPPCADLRNQKTICFADVLAIIPFANGFTKVE